MQARQGVASTHKGAYINVRDCVGAEQQSIAPYFPVAEFKCKQDKKGAALPTEVYIDVHAQGKT